MFCNLPGTSLRADPGPHHEHGHQGDDDPHHDDGFINGNIHSTEGQGDPVVQLKRMKRTFFHGAFVCPFSVSL